MTETTIKHLSTTATIISVVTGVVISVLTYKAAADRDAKTRKMEAARPFLELRQKLYVEALNTAAVLASPSYHDSTEIAKAKKRFLELYWGELVLVENKGIDTLMVDIAREQNLLTDTCAAKDYIITLARSMRQSLKQSWGIDSSFIGEVYE